MAGRRLIACVGAAAMLLAGCVGGDPEGDADPAATASSPAVTKGGPLAVAIDSDPGQLNPAITTSGGTHTAADLMFNGLVELTPDLEPVPEL